MEQQAHAPAMATRSRKKSLERPVALQKIHVSILTNREENKELEEILKRMGCLVLLENSWRVRREGMVREVVA